ncbi:MAG: CgeB family protein [Candidatus Promineifilaceae bacterium]
MRKPTLLIYGSSNHGALGWSYLNAFRALGYEATIFDQRDAAKHLTVYASNRIVHRLTIRSLAYRRAASRAWNQAIIDAVLTQKPDFFLIIKGDWIMPETIARIQQSGVKVFIFHPDTPFPTSGNYRPETVPSAKQCDVYFIWSRLLQAQLQSADVQQVEYLPFAWDADLFPHVENADHTYDHDVVFIGGWDSHRENTLTKVAAHYNLKIWGPDYWATRTQRNSPLKQCWQGRPVLSTEASRILSRSKISLNILRQQNLPDGTNMRTFEQPGCGVFTLANDTLGATEIFPRDTACAYFQSDDGCLAQIERYLGNAKARVAMNRHAHDIVYSGHQYQQRAAQIVQVFNNL